MKCIIPLLILVVFLGGCKGSKTDLFDVVYEVNFEGTWNASTHPTGYPANAHFSPLFVGSHSSSNFLFEMGLDASQGIQEMAETGATETLIDEIQKEINTGKFFDKNIGSSFDSPGNNSLQVGLRPDFSYVSIVSMVAPSPDWFVSATTNLYDVTDGLWYDVVTVDVMTYDAGTDSGIDFTSSNDPTDPQAPINLVSTGPLVLSIDTIVKNMGRVVFTRVK